MDKQLHLRAPEEGRERGEREGRERGREGAGGRERGEREQYSRHPIKQLHTIWVKKTSHKLNGHPFHKNGVRTGHERRLNGNGCHIEWPVYGKVFCRIL